jgi:uncharacterized protein
VYADSSALVKLVIEEPESGELELHLARGVTVATSRLALVEVPRATKLANPSFEAQQGAQRLLDSCMLIDVGDRVLRASAALTSRDVRTLDAIHLASALRIAADEFVGYDRRLNRAAAERGLAVATPGAAN